MYLQVPLKLSLITCTIFLYSVITEYNKPGRGLMSLTSMYKAVICEQLVTILIYPSIKITGNQFWKITFSIYAVLLHFHPMHDRM